MNTTTAWYLGFRGEKTALLGGLLYTPGELDEYSRQQNMRDYATTGAGIGASAGMFHGLASGRAGGLKTLIGGLAGGGVGAGLSSLFGGDAAAERLRGDIAAANDPTSFL